MPLVVDGFLPYQVIANDRRVHVLHGANDRPAVLVVVDRAYAQQRTARTARRLRSERRGKVIGCGDIDLDLIPFNPATAAVIDKPVQRVIVALELVQAALDCMPEIAQLAKKRRAYLKLKADANKLLAARKDLENDLADLDEDEAFCNAAVDQAQSEMQKPENHRLMKEFEQQLAGIAKKLDKINFARKDKIAALEKAKSNEAYATEYIAKFEASVIEDTRAAREKADEIRNRIEVSRHQRDALIKTVDSSIIDTYNKASKRFNGLGVEKLEGAVPSVCRMSLSPSSMDSLKGADEVAECPYCHRLLVISAEEE